MGIHSISRYKQIMKTAIIITLSVVLAISSAAKLPSSIEPCAKEDLECIKARGYDFLALMGGGLKQYGIPPVDPLFIKSIDIAGRGGAVDLAQHFEDSNLIGLTSSKLKDMSMNLSPDNCEFSFSAFTPVLSMVGQHTMKGKLLLFQLNGHGASNITLTNVDTEHKIKCKVVPRDGKNYIEITDYDLDMESKKIYFDLENVIDGNAALSAEVNKVANENDQEIYKEVRPDYEATFAHILASILQKLFSKVSTEELFA